MGKYSIKELEQLSGIKAHTIRIWEKRHQIIAPSRTDTNIRYYSDDDLKKILNISILNSNGLKISKIADLSSEELSLKVEELSHQRPEMEMHIDRMVIAMVELDEIKFEKLISDLTLKYGFVNTIKNIIYPFLEKIGVLWLTGNINPAQEHFISNLIRQKLIVAIDGLPVTNKPEAKRVILFLPENELHELGLLFYHYLIKRLSYKTYYLGQCVPLDDLENVVKIRKPHYLVTSISTTSTEKRLKDNIYSLSNAFPECHLYVSAKQINHFAIELPKNVTKFVGPQELSMIFTENLNN